MKNLCLVKSLYLLPSGRLVPFNPYYAALAAVTIVVVAAILVPILVFT